MAASLRMRTPTGVLLGVTIFLWAALLVELAGVARWMHPLLKTLGGTVVFGAMLVCPAASALLAWRAALAEPRRGGRRLVVALGVVLVAAWVAVIGTSLAYRAITATPPNPHTPRPVEPASGLPVFPGAEGFGTRTPAGRGGRVIEVTTLADSGPGSLRAALDVAEPRIIVFRVAGAIELESLLFINHPFVTVAGQTAPGDGICLKHCGLAITTHDVLVQHLRIRPGAEGNVRPDHNDAVAVLGKQGKSDGAYNVVLDHISASWGEDETISTWFGAHDVTLSWSIVSEALNRGRHPKKTHSAGLLIGDSSYHVSIHHTLLAHNGFRNPLIAKGGTHEVVNNVVYNWSSEAAEILDYDSNSFLNLIGNTFLPGPNTPETPYEIVILPERGVPRLFVEGNIGPHRPTAELDEWSLVAFGWGHQRPEAKYRAAARFAAHTVTASSAREAYDRVLAEAGATAPRRDAVDRRIVREVENRTGAIIDSPEQVGGYPTLRSAAPPPDADHDGMPDAWEAARRLNPQDASDASEDRDGDGYTNIEEYLHSLTAR